MLRGRRAERRLREAGVDPAHVAARVRAIFAAVQSARVTADASAAETFLAERIVDLPDTGLWLETLPVEVDLARGSALSFRREVPREKLQFGEAVVVDVRIEKADIDEADTLSVRVRVESDLPTRLEPRATLRVREHWQLTCEDADWVVEGFEVTAGRRQGGGSGGDPDGIDWDLDL